MWFESLSFLGLILVLDLSSSVCVIDRWTPPQRWLEPPSMLLENCSSGEVVAWVFRKPKVLVRCKNGHKNQPYCTVYSPKENCAKNYEFVCGSRTKNKNLSYILATIKLASQGSNRGNKIADMCKSHIWRGKAIDQYISWLSMPKKINSYVT